MENIFTFDTFDFNIIKNASVQKRKKGNQGKRNNKRKYKNLFCAFDIETTNDLTINQAYMYIWQFQIDEYTITGRTWDDFLVFMNRVADQLDDNVYIVVYVHNLSFEFSFLKGIYSFEPEEVFAIESRKVLKCEMLNHFEFRCSYLLTNMNLASFTKKMGVIEKLSGEEFDYTKIRYPWTKLSDREFEYCITDVISLVEALRVYFSIENDNFYTIPLTSTGFVRRDVKRAMRHYNRADLQKQLPDLDIYRLLRQAFRGGNTHANRYYSGMILENVSSFDRVSSYPDVQINELFPMGNWIHEPEPDLERVIRKIYKQKRACLLCIAFYDIRLKNPMDGCPYIAKHKCINLRDHYNDNGRILWADYLEVALTDIDFKIIYEQYDFESIAVLNMYHTRYGRLPRPLRDEVKKFFRAKTELKNVPGAELYYMLAKAKLNSIYGMSVQNLVKQNIKYINDEFVHEHEPELDLLIKANKKAFMMYSWGVWTTAHARKQLQVAIDKVAEQFVYCDTDSVKYIDNGKIDFNEYNKNRIKISESNDGYADDINGERYYLGLYDFEGIYKKFITLGAKKYAYIDQEDQLHLTVAGVGKSKGATELGERGGIEQFKEGFIFRKAGGTEAVYNDRPEIESINIDGHELKISSNVMIKQSIYTLGITGEYKKILSNPKIWLDLFN